MKQFLHLFTWRQVTASNYSRVLAALILPALIISCRIPRNQQPGKPFTYRTDIGIQGAGSNDIRNNLFERLQNQLDDSLQTKTATAFEFRAPWRTRKHGPLPLISIYKKLDHPAVYDSSAVDRSIIYMTSLLKSNGYFAPAIKDTMRVKKIHVVHPGADSLNTRPEVRRLMRNQERVILAFTAIPGKQTTFDSVAFDLETAPLQQLAIESKSQSLLAKGQPYSKLILANEISRLVDTFHNHGYYRFSKEDLYVEHDTVIAALIDPTLDPVQQEILLEQLKGKRDKPTINIVVRQRPVKDSSHLIKYFIGQVTVYPDLPTTEDTGFVHTDSTRIRGIDFISRTKKFKLPFLSNYVYLRPGRLFRQETYFNMSNRLSSLSAWQYTNIDFEDSPLSDTLLDMTIRMYPAKKLKLTTDLEASRNTNDIVTASNLFGLGVNFGIQNRNAFRSSVQTNTNLRGGVEFGSNFIQTKQASISHTISFPRFIPPKLPFHLETKLRQQQTLLNINASYTERRRFYDLKSVNTSWGLQGTRTRVRNVKDKTVTSTKTYLLKLPNIEYSVLNQGDSLRTILNKNPQLIYAFRTGLVLGTDFLYNSVRQKGNATNSFLLHAEQSGALLGLIRQLDEGDLLRFVKAELEFRHHLEYGKSQLVFRIYGGAGIAYGRQRSGYEQALPFYKAFFAGGPNSMRAWQVRQLGLGSSKFYQDSSRAGLDRFGDIKLEGNVEYRFFLGSLFGIKFRSALYTDIGNIWSRKPVDTTAAAAGSDFQLNRFYKELAVGAGTGLRLDFNYFIIRLDWAYKIRDPQRLEFPDRWFYDLHILDGQFQLGINYPF